MSAINGLVSGGFDWRAIDIIFTRNIPTNDADIADMINKLEGIVSNETLLAQIPFVEDVEAETERVKQQKEEEKIDNPFYASGINYRTRAQEKDEEAKEDELD